jgi:Spy/CpxP family protein refolding chaperone
MNARTKGWITAAALLIAVFMAGALSAVAVVQLTRPSPEWVDGRPARGGPDGGPGFRRGRDGRFGGMRGPDGGRSELFLDMLTERLALSDEQQDQIREIFLSREQAAEEVMRGMRERLRSALDSTDLEIRGVLDPEQQDEFDRFQEEGRERLGRRFPGEGRSGPPRKGRPPRPD